MTPVHAAAVRRRAWQGWSGAVPACLRCRERCLGTREAVDTPDNSPPEAAHMMQTRIYLSALTSAILDAERIAPTTQKLAWVPLHADAAGQEIQLNVLASQLNRAAWQRRACGIGAKGLWAYDWVLIGTGHADHQYLIRQINRRRRTRVLSLLQPQHAGFVEPVAVARWLIKECFGSGKNEVGLDEYELCKYNAWQRHITLAMLVFHSSPSPHTKPKKGGQ